MVTIRSATKGDYQGLCSVLAELDELHWRALPAIYRKPEGPVRSTAYLDQITRDTDHGTFVALEDGQIVGCAHVEKRQARYIPIHVTRQFAHVEAIGVKRSHQRRGIGTLLMAEVEDWARRKALEHIELGVWDFNESAVAFYEGQGYGTTIRSMAKDLPSSAGNTDPVRK